MSRSAKYIIWDDGITECAMVFNNHLTHQTVALRMGVEPTSAGFVRIGRDTAGTSTEITAFGSSTSLGLRSRPEDNGILCQALMPGI